MPLANVTVLDQNTYEDLRNEEIKRSENNQLATGAIIEHSVQDDGTGSLFIGYGWDVDQNSANDTIDLFDNAGIPLTQAEQVALTQYKCGTINEADFLAAWAGVTVTEAEATDLLNVAVEEWEAGLTAALGADDIQISSERAAFISQTYNLGSGAGIPANIPTQIGLVQRNPQDDPGRFEQRAEILWDIAYYSYSLTQDIAVLFGLQNRRFREADTFDLYSSDSEPQTNEEAKFIYQFLARKNGTRVLSIRFREYDRS